MNTKGIPMMQYKVQNNFPNELVGTTSPYPMVTTCEKRLGCILQYF
jgi:hypothetical protein